MVEPTLIIDLDSRTTRGAIRNRDIQRLKQHLLLNNLVILPSDTCYSLAACAITKTLYQTINEILDRKDLPISIAFPSFLVAESFAEFDYYTRMLLEKFTPGPITIICKVTSTKDPENRHLLREVVRSKDGTVGVRISDSFIECQIAGCTKYPITTVAIRDEQGNIVQNFKQALEIVKNGIKKIKDKPEIIAIEGEQFFKKQSTVIKVDNGNIKLIREGQIDFNTINKVFNNDYPISNIEDWT